MFFSAIRRKKLGVRTSRPYAGVLPEYYLAISKK